MTLQDLRFSAQMAQFSPKEVRDDVLRAIEATPHLPGTTLVEVTEDHVTVENVTYSRLFWKPTSVLPDQSLPLDG